MTKASVRYRERDNNQLSAVPPSFQMFDFATRNCLAADFTSFVALTQEQAERTLARLSTNGNARTTKNANRPKPSSENSRPSVPNSNVSP